MGRSRSPVRAGPPGSVFRSKPPTALGGKAQRQRTLSGRLLNLLGTCSFRRCGGSVPFSSLLMEDRISDAVKERLDVLGPPQVVDGGGHVMQAGRELLEVGAQGRGRCGFDQRLAENPAPSIPAGRWPTVSKDTP